MRPLRSALRKNLDVVEADSGYLLVSSACREVGCASSWALRKMGTNWNDATPRARSSSAGRKRSNGAKGGRPSGAASGAAAAGEAQAAGGSGAPDLLPDPAHDGAHAVVEASLVGSQVCSRLFLRARLRGGPVICASVASVCDIVPPH